MVRIVLALSALAGFWVFAAGVILPDAQLIAAGILLMVVALLMSWDYDRRHP